MADRGVNQVTLLGRLACEPDVKTTMGGIEYCWLKLAVNTERPGRAGESKVEYVRCTFFNCAGTLPYLRTGRQLHITGRLESYQRDKDAPMQMNVQVDRLIMTDNKPEGVEVNNTEGYTAELQERNGALLNANDALKAEVERLTKQLAAARPSPFEEDTERKTRVPIGRFNGGNPKYPANPATAGIGHFPKRKRATAKRPAKGGGKSR